MSEFKRMFKEIPEAKEWFYNYVKAGRKHNPQIISDQLVKEGKAEAITLPEDPDEAKRVLAGIIKRYSKE